MDPPLRRSQQTAYKQPPTQQQYEQNVAATAQAALSSEHTPAPNNAATNGRKRKASGQPGSRGVANLTPEQLAKKRANDREAQRAIRERTRHTIESLELRIRELESQQPFQELQRVVQERDRALQECETLRRRLSAVAGIVGPTHPGLNGMLVPYDFTIDPVMLTFDDSELAALTAQQSPLPPAGQVQQQQQQVQQYSQRSPSAPYGQQHLHPDLRSPHSQSAHPSPVSHSANEATMYEAGLGTLRKWSPSLDRSPQAHYQQNGLSFDVPQPPPAQMQMHMQQPSNGERHGLSFLLGQQRSISPNQPQPQRSSPSGQTHVETPIFARLPLNAPPACPLDFLLGDFVAACRQQLQHGTARDAVLGPEYPSFAALKDPNGPHQRACHPVTALLVDMVSKFPGLSGMPEKVAVLYVMFSIMRWHICPCASCYERLPPWARPVDAQLTTPHQLWVDHIPWPTMRSRLSVGATAGAQVKFDDFFVPLTTTISVNWPYPQEHVLISTPVVSPGGETEVKINPVFEDHLRKLENWSLGSEFRRILPELVDDEVRIEDWSG